MSIRNNTALEMNPDHPKTGQLRAWYDGGGKTQSVTALSGGGASGGGGGVGRSDRFATIQQIEDEGANGG
ncbi:hypothetical protein, partial [Pseudomonas aeruginosa]|uniref:hypothetical protein n=1 Tax=Pseudomonas aeruginosa TaxID=287 RepID=UPI00196900A3